jgi:hypothetical protein
MQPSYSYSCSARRTVLVAENSRAYWPIHCPWTCVVQVSPLGRVKRRNTVFLPRRILNGVAHRAAHHRSGITWRHNSKHLRTGEVGWGLRFASTDLHLPGMSQRTQHGSVRGRFNALTEPRWGSHVRGSRSRGSRVSRQPLAVRHNRMNTATRFRLNSTNGVEGARSKPAPIPMLCYPTFSAGGDHMDRSDGS